MPLIEVKTRMSNYIPYPGGLEMSVEPIVA